MNHTTVPELGAIQFQPNNQSVRQLSQQERKLVAEIVRSVNVDHGTIGNGEIGSNPAIRYFSIYTPGSLQAPAGGCLFRAATGLARAESPRF